MTDPTPTVPATEAAPPESAAARLAILEKEVADARKEAAKYRTTLRQQEQAQEEAARKQAEEQGEFKRLYEETQAKLTALAAEAEAAKLTALRLQVASELGLPQGLAERLRGTTPAEIKADADALLAAIRAAAPAPAAGAAPAPIPATNPATGRGAPAAFDPRNPPRLDSISWKT